MSARGPAQAIPMPARKRCMVRDGAASRGVWACIPPRVIRKDAFSFSPWVCRQRNLVERFFNRIQRLRGLVPRCDRRPDNHLVALKLASIRTRIAGI